MKRLQLVVDDVEAAAAHLDSAGVEHSGLQHVEHGQMRSGPAPDRADFSSFVFIADPDGNGWPSRRRGTAPAARQRAVQPPSTSSVCPVTSDPAGEQR